MQRIVLAALVAASVALIFAIARVFYDVLENGGIGVLPEDEDIDEELLKLLKDIRQED